MEPWRWGVAPILLVAVYTDWRWQKIYNWLTFPAMALGMVAAIAAGALRAGASGALSGGVQSLLGFGLLAAVFLLLTLSGGMKAGDLKLMAAIGAWLGWPLAISALLYVAIAGGVFSVVWAAVHGALWRTLGQVKSFFEALRGGLDPTQVVRESVAPMFPYGISIAIGTLAAMIGPPLVALPAWRL